MGFPEQPTPEMRRFEWIQSGGWGSRGGVRGGVNPSPRIGEDEYLEDLWIQWTAKALLNAQPRGLADYNII